MPKSTRTIWRYIAIPIEMEERIKRIIEADRYPTGKWRSKDQFVLECLKEIVPRYEMVKEERSPTR